ncbi:MAG TPA: rhodanese-like domain-containing protein [Bryobacteraceae bacterium]
MLKTFVIPLLAALMFAAQPSSDPWPAPALLQPADLASAKPQPATFYVGFPILYRGAHIQNAVLAGPGSKPEGLEALTKALRPLPRDREIVLYCGCCPFDKCPNIRPAYRTAAGLGFMHIKVLMLKTNLHTDWIAKSYPTER